MLVLYLEAPDEKNNYCASGLKGVQMELTIHTQIWGDIFEVRIEPVEGFRPESVIGRALALAAEQTPGWSKKRHSSLQVSHRNPKPEDFVAISNAFEEALLELLGSLRTYTVRISEPNAV